MLKVTVPAPHTARRDSAPMTHRHRTSAVTIAARLLTITVVLILVATPATVGAQTQTAASTAAGDTGGEGQPQVVSTTGGTFQDSLGYLMVALLACGSLYAVCRTSHRT